MSRRLGTLDIRAWDLRPIYAGVAAMLGLAFVVELVLLYQIIDRQGAIGTDLAFFRSVAERWLETGVYYTERQLSGPFVVETQVDNIYPPVALFLFVPFVFVPAFLWWLIPLGLIAYVAWWCRPQPWAWPILIGLLAFPKTPATILFGNSDVWAVAFSAAGMRWIWPSVLVSFKPSVGFLALPGIANRRWWIAAAVLAVVNLPLLPLWLQYPTVVMNSDANLLRSLGDLPLFLVPFVAWLASSRRGEMPMRAWARKLLTG